MTSGELGRQAGGQAPTLDSDPPLENEAVVALIATLAQPGLVAQESTRSLVAIGTPATSALIRCLASSQPSTRWHAAAALREIASPESAAALVAALTDDDAGVRWEAVKALAAIGRPSLPPLLDALATQPLSAWLATGAHRVLRRLSPYFPELHLDQLCRMLEHTNDHVGVPLEAHRLLHSSPSGSALLS